MIEFFPFQMGALFLTYWEMSFNILNLPKLEYAFRKCYFAANGVGVWKDRYAVAKWPSFLGAAKMVNNT